MTIDKSEGGIDMQRLASYVVTGVLLMLALKIVVGFAVFSKTARYREPPYRLIAPVTSYEMVPREGALDEGLSDTAIEANQKAARKSSAPEAH